MRYLRKSYYYAAAVASRAFSSHKHDDILLYTTTEFHEYYYKPDVGKAICAKRWERRTTTNGHRCRERERCELRNCRDTFTLNFTAPRTTDGSRGQRRLSYCRTRWRKPRFRNTWSLENNNRRGCHHRAKQLLSVRGSCARSIQRRDDGYK